MGLCAHIAKHPEHANKIYEEVKDVNVQDVRTLTKHCPHLEAVVMESLRLSPALLTGGNRKTTKNGTIIAGVRVPEHTTIVAPRYTISRRKSPRM